MKRIQLSTILAAGIFFLFSGSASALTILDLSGSTTTTTTTETTVTEPVVEPVEATAEDTEQSSASGNSADHRRDGEHRHNLKKIKSNKHGHHKKKGHKRRWY